MADVGDFVGRVVRGDVRELDGTAVEPSSGKLVPRGGFGGDESKVSGGVSAGKGVERLGEGEGFKAIFSCTGVSFLAVFCCCL